VFPEGSRSPTGELQTPKDGLAVLALRTGATIVPIGISNTDRVWPKGRPIPRPGGHATMRVGEPFKLADLLPTHANDVRAVFAKERFSLSKEDVDLVVQVVAKYL